MAFPEWKEINRSYNVQEARGAATDLKSRRAAEGHILCTNESSGTSLLCRQHLMCRPRLDPTCTAKRGRDAFGCCQDVQPPYVT